MTDSPTAKGVLTDLHGVEFWLHLGGAVLLSVAVSQLVQKPVISWARSGNSYDSAAAAAAKVAKAAKAAK
jgi:hypothetical protein